MLSKLTRINISNVAEKLEQSFLGRNEPMAWTVKNSDLKTIINNVHEAIFLLDKHGIIADVNEKSVDMFQLSYNQLLGLNFFLSLTDSTITVDEWEKLHQKVFGGHEALQEWRSRRPIDNTVFHSELFVKKITIAEEAFMLVTLRDIHDQKLTEQKLHELATTDDLTGIYNRRYFLQAFEFEIERARRYKKPLSLLMLDADHFKRINDNFGHQTGDRCLVELANMTTRVLRDIDIFGRLGGEEFAVVLPETTQGEAEFVAERLLKAINQIRVPTHKGVVTMTISIGISSLDANGGDLCSVMKAADAALYKAKASGRNRFITNTQSIQA
jgi:diguanylate cyclase (GGDEF)-like protein/PAS domain S-box-containing protein